MVLLIVALAGGPVNPATLLPIPEAAEPAVTTTTDATTPSPEANIVATQRNQRLFLYQVALPVLAPAIDVFAVLSLWSDPVAGALAWLGFLALQLIPAVIAFRLDGERLRPLWAVALQPVVYRQLMYLVVIQSVITALAGAVLPWQKLKRTGSAAQDAPEIDERTVPLNRRELVR